MHELGSESIVGPSWHGLVWNMIKACVKHQDHLVPAAKALSLYRGDELRVSLASVLRIEKSGRFLLVRSRHRREAYGPFGGVFKYYDVARELLDRVEFESDGHSKGQTTDFERDLRGRLPARNLPVFLNWFKARSGREEQDCLRRELIEELQDIHAPESIVAAVGRLSYDLVRRVHEGPIRHKNLREPQFRYFEVYRPVVCADSAKLVDLLFGLAEEQTGELVIVGTPEIKRLRSNDGRVIGGHTQYLLSSRWHGVEPPEITI